MHRLLLSALILLFLAGAMPAAPPTDAELDASIARNRQGVLVIRARPGTQIRVQQLKHEFWFGATLPGAVFTGRASAEDTAKFREVFLSHFNAGVIESAFKWHDMEKEKGKVDYSTVDSMLDWADENGLPLRGHCIFWGVPKYVQPWVKELADGPLRTAIGQRGRSITARYRDRFAEYDLNNEMIHADYYAQRLGPGLVKEMALWARDGDPKAKLFFNDYDITTGKRLDDYVKDIRRILDLGAPMSGIGVQGHLHGDEFDAEALQNALNVLAQFHLPIRITEFNFPGQRSRHYQKREDVLTPEEEQAKAAAMTRYFRICFAHPAVTGIMMWGFWEGANWIPQSSLFKRDWTPTPAGLAYEQLVLKKWWTNWQGTAGADGTVAVPAYFGKHRVTAGGREVLADLTKAKGVTMVDIQ
jgi:GH35 family endo-1,4-beta-xylanase